MNGGDLRSAPYQDPQVSNSAFDHVNVMVYVQCKGPRWCFRARLMMMLEFEKQMRTDVLICSVAQKLRMMPAAEYQISTIDIRVSIDHDGFAKHKRNFHGP
jgi:hypothetical protein